MFLTKKVLNPTPVLLSIRTARMMGINQTEDIFSVYSFREESSDDEADIEEEYKPKRSRFYGYSQGEPEERNEEELKKKKWAIGAKSLP